MNFSAVILAGGASQRMGQDKSWLEFKGQTLLIHQVALVRRLKTAELFISGRPQTDYSCTGCCVLLDRESGCGPIAGLERALTAALYPLLLVVPVDMPCLSASLLEKLLAQCAPRTGVLPVREGEIEPLVGFYPATASALASRCLGQRRYAAREFASACLAAGFIKLYEVDSTDFGCFVNLNQPADLNRPELQPRRT